MSIADDAIIVADPRGDQIIPAPGPTGLEVWDPAFVRDLTQAIRDPRPRTDATNMTSEEQIDFINRVTRSG